jgi:hypothetical protein
MKGVEPLQRDDDEVYRHLFTNDVDGAGNSNRADCCFLCRE